MSIGSDSRRMTARSGLKQGVSGGTGHVRIGTAQSPEQFQPLSGVGPGTTRSALSHLAGAVDFDVLALVAPHAAVPTRSSQSIQREYNARFGIGAA